jgi:DNA replication protein DnaC
MFCLIRALLTKYPRIDLGFWPYERIQEKFLQEFKEYGSASSFKRSLIEKDILFIDELAFHSTDRGTRDISSIIDKRIEWKRPTTITTNYDHSQIAKIYGERICSRLKFYHWKEFAGDDLREKYSDEW